jgi:hypothetical protein
VVREVIARRVVGSKSTFFREISVDCSSNLSYLRVIQMFSRALFPRCSRHDTSCNLKSFWGINAICHSSYCLPLPDPSPHVNNCIRISTRVSMLFCWDLSLPTGAPDSHPRRGNLCLSFHFLHDCLLILQ